MMQVDLELSDSSSSSNFLSEGLESLGCMQGPTQAAHLPQLLVPPYQHHTSHASSRGLGEASSASSGHPTRKVTMSPDSSLYYAQRQCHDSSLPLGLPRCPCRQCACDYYPVPSTPLDGKRITAIDMIKSATAAITPSANRTWKAASKSPSPIASVCHRHHGKR